MMPWRHSPVYIPFGTRLRFIDWLNFEYTVWACITLFGLLVFSVIAFYKSLMMVLIMNLTMYKVFGYDYHDAIPLAAIMVFPIWIWTICFGAMVLTWSGVVLATRRRSHQKIARLTFSKVACLKSYGHESDFKGIKDRDAAVGASSTTTGTEGVESPILKFQVVNDRANSAVGSIKNAEMTVCCRKQESPYEEFLLKLKKSKQDDLKFVMYGVHDLDVNSPLLSSMAVEGIKANGGKWPTHWLMDPNRKLNFDSIFVKFSGLSEANGITVYKFTEYKITDIVAGCDFAPVVMDGKLKFEFVHDVISMKTQVGKICA